MKYEHFKKTQTKEEFLTGRDETFSELDDAVKDALYSKYIVKCKVFQRDNFKCQNELCETPKQDLTMHHVKWQKNGGKHAERNCLTLCKTCHQGFHKGKREIKIYDDPDLPAHFRGHTFIFERESQINWKEIKSNMKKLRKEMREHHGIRLTAKQMRLLMLFLYAPYEDIE